MLSVTALAAPERAADMMDPIPLPQPIPPTDGWVFTVTPYFWAAGLSGDVGVFGRSPVDIDMDFSDLFEDPHFASMGNFEAHNGTRGAFADLMYVNTELDASIERSVLGVPTRLDAGVETESFTGTFMTEEILSGLRGCEEFSSGTPAAGVTRQLRPSPPMPVTLAAAFLAATSSFAFAQSSEDLAKKLSSPIASLVSVPFQFNYDHGYGPDDGDRAVLNIQPVIPFSLSDNWNVISRTIIPVISQDDIAGHSGSQFGLGDITQSLFFSPARPTDGGITWGVGPVLVLPTATDELLGGEKWGAGPTGVALKQDGPWTYGILANHVWSFAGASGRPDVSATFLQPFVSYTTQEAWTFALNTESTYDWNGGDWAVPINFSVSKLITVDKQPISLSTGIRYWATAPDNGPDGLGFRAAVTFLFPK